MHVVFNDKHSLKFKQVVDIDDEREKMDVNNKWIREGRLQREVV